MSLTTDLNSNRLMFSVWRLRAGLERKFQKGHPWVFSSDLDQSPKDLAPGSFVELRSSTDGFLAFGYGNPSTLIAFRALSRIPIGNEVRDMLTLLGGILERAAQLRHDIGIDTYSHRLVFGEADGLPGVIVDRYRSDDGQVFVVQASTAGADHLLPYLTASLVQFASGELAFGGQGRALPTAIVVAQDSSSRTLEGLGREVRRVVRTWPESVPFRPELCRIQVQSVAGVAHYWVNFIDGQKTGFFLDQRLNVRLAWPLFDQRMCRSANSAKPVKMLDLFCYVGQWSVQAALAARVRGSALEVDLVDASGLALELAARNVSEAGGKSNSRKADVLQAIGSLPIGQYDIVICDPPAFVKKKKDLPAGLAAYQKLNREAIRRVSPGGIFVTCSCSGLVTDADFDEMLASAVRASGRDVRWVARGGHGEDHVFASEFPQGKYLKGLVGVVL